MADQMARVANVQANSLSKHALRCRKLLDAKIVVVFLVNQEIDLRAPVLVARQQILLVEIAHERFERGLFMAALRHRQIVSAGSPDIDDLVQVEARQARKRTAQDNEGVFGGDQLSERCTKRLVVRVDPADLVFAGNAAVCQREGIAHGRAGVFRNEGVDGVRRVNVERVLGREGVGAIAGELLAGRRKVERACS